MGVKVYYPFGREKLAEDLADVMDYVGSEVSINDEGIKITSPLRSGLLSKVDYDYMKGSFEFETGDDFHLYEDDVVYSFTEYIVGGDTNEYEHVRGDLLAFLDTGNVRWYEDTFTSSVVFSDYVEYRMHQMIMEIDGVTKLN